MYFGGDFEIRFLVALMQVMFILEYGVNYGY